MRVGLAGAVHGQAVRRDGARVQYLGRADCLRAGPGESGGLADRVEFVEDDYRKVRGEYDAFVSVGMLEHVGLADYPTLGGVIDRSLTERGRGLLHFIGRNRPGPLNPWIRKRIFPGAYPPTLPEVFENVLEPWDLSVLDVENLRLHYAATLEHWRRRFDAAADEVAKMFDDAFVRAWRLYLAGSQAAFATGTMQLFQVVFARGASNAIPWTRQQHDRCGRAMDTCDALIVGGGPAGSTCAWKLRQAGLDVMVIDAAVFRATRSAPDGLRRRSSPNWISIPRRIGSASSIPSPQGAGRSSPSPDSVSGSSAVARKSRRSTVVPSASASVAASSITTCCSDRARG